MSDRPLTSPAVTWADRGIVAVAILIPSIVTWVYFIWLADSHSKWQQIAFTAGKLIQFALPIAWVLLREPGRMGLSWPNWRTALGDWLPGIVFGLVVVAAMLLLYHFALKPMGWIDEAAPQMLEKARDFGVMSRLGYLALSAFYALIHSGLEEYYWRWFVFGQLCRFQRVGVAAVVSSLGFMAHHVILLGFYFGWTSLWTYLFSFAVAVGGLFWAWTYHRTQSIYAPWISHMIVDAGIFLLGYDVVRVLLG